MAETKPKDTVDVEAGPTSLEKTGKSDIGDNIDTHHADVALHEYAESEGYVIDADNADTSGLKRAKDGHTILIPQPSDDPNDPLNWSWAIKHVTLFIVASTAFLPDYGSATGAVTLLSQAAEWNMTPDEVNHSQAGNVFMLGAGGIFGMFPCAL